MGNIFRAQEYCFFKIFTYVCRNKYQHQKDMTLKTISLSALLMLFTGTISASKENKDVVINECSDVYTFTADAQGNITVKNLISTEYHSLTERNISIQPYVLYGDFISLDGSSGKGVPQYRNATPENVFYDDTKVCFYNIYLDRKHREAKTKFERTFKDIRYFTRVYLPEEYKIVHKTVVFRIPKTLSQFELIPKNFNSSVTSKITKESNYTVYTYTISNMDGTTTEANMPSMASIYPYILIKGAFKDYKELYRWSNSLTKIDCNIPNLQAILQEIGHDNKTDMDRIRATYEWVQRHIRYVAFEAGITGHQPDRPAEVIRKCYGDCKGMAMLLCTLLKAQKFDARLVDIGTQDIPYRISEIPTLASANHMICALNYGGKTYWLDATNRYIPITHVPGNIQGREAIVENGADCELKTLPYMDAHTSTDSLLYIYTLTMKNSKPLLTGTVTDSWSGDMKEFFMQSYDNATQENKAVFLANAINDDTHSATITDAKWINDTRKTQWAVLKGNIENDKKIQMLDGELYVEMNPNNDMFSQRIDTTNRKHAYVFPLRCRIVRQVELKLPPNYKATLPKSQSFACKQGAMQCYFAKQGNKIIFRRVLTITDRTVPREQIPQWNECLRQWNDACNEQIVLTLK